MYPSCKILQIIVCIVLQSKFRHKRGPSQSQFYQGGWKFSRGAKGKGAKQEWDKNSLTIWNWLERPDPFEAFAQSLLPSIDELSQVNFHLISSYPVDSLIAKLLIIWWIVQFYTCSLQRGRVLFQLRWNLSSNELKGCCSNQRSPFIKPLRKTNCSQLLI